MNQISNSSKDVGTGFKGKLSLLRLMLFTLIVVIATNSIVFAATSNMEPAKKEFVNILESVNKVLKDKTKNVTELPKKGVVESKTTTEMKASYFSDEEYTSETEYKITFDMDDGKFIIHTGNISLFIDEKDNRLYFKEDNGSEIFMAELSEEFKLMLKEFINEYTKEDSRVEVEIVSEVIDAVIKNLDNKYFTTGKKDANGVIEYKLSFDAKGLSDFVYNVTNTLTENKKFVAAMKEYMEADYYYYKSFTEDDVIKEMNRETLYIMDSLNDMENLKLEISLFEKGTGVKNLTGVKFNFEADENKLALDLTGDAGKTLMKSKKFDLHFQAISDDNEVKMDVKVDEKKITIELLSREHHEGYDWDSVDWNSDMSIYEIFNNIKIVKEERTSQMLIEISTKDDKVFEKTGNIEIMLKNVEKNLDLELNQINSESEEISVLVIRSTDGNQFAKSKEIEIFAKDGDEILEDKIIITTTDNKAFEESKSIELRMDDFSLRLIADDNKELRKSTDLKLWMKAGDEEFEVIHVKANDKKAFDKTGDIEIHYDVDGSKMDMQVKSKDKKALKDSQNLFIELSSESGSSSSRIVIDGKNFEYENSYSYVFLGLYKNMKTSFREEKTLNFNKLFDTKGAKQITMEELEEKVNAVYNAM
ncbi:MAG: hypothetical protein IJ215_05430 [Clostridia bacterium]|nr:hypothetical protein [Clostridia bacterium]